VPKGWEHPLDDEGKYKPLLENYERDARDFDKMEGEKGLREALDYYGQRPDAKGYMGIGWKEEDRVLYQMYETTTEGAPISPAFETQEELAHWLADNGASTFGYGTATYEGWIRIMGS
jgi:hypothetical protein